MVAARIRRIGLGLGLGLGLGCGGGGTGPELVSVTPGSAAQAAQVVVSGERLCGASGDCATAGGQLDLGLDEPVRAIVTSYAAGSIVFTVPTVAPVGVTQLVLTVDDDSSNALSFTVLAPI